MDARTGGRERGREAEVREQGRERRRKTKGLVEETVRRHFNYDVDNDDDNMNNK